MCVCVCVCVIEGERGERESACGGRNTMHMDGRTKDEAVKDYMCLLILNQHVKD